MSNDFVFAMLMASLSMALVAISFPDSKNETVVEKTCKAGYSQSCKKTN